MDAVTLAAAKAYSNSRLNWRGAWVATTSYAKNDLVSYNGGLYRAPNAFTSTGSFVKANWVELVQQSGTYVPSLSNVIAVDPLGLGSADRARSRALAQTRYEDGTELIEQGTTWDGWTNWDATLFAQSGGQLQSGWDTGEGTPILTKTFSVAPTKTLRVVGSFVVPATAVGTSNALYAQVGITESASASPAYTTVLGVGVGEKHLPLFWEDLAIGSAAAEEGATVLAAGTWYFEIVVDTNYLSLSISSADGATVYKRQKLRTTCLPGSGVTKVTVVNRDSRKATGVTIGPVFAKTEASTGRRRSATSAEGGAVRSVWTRPTADQTVLDNLQILEPPGLDDRSPVPWIMWCHGSGRTASDLGVAATYTMIAGLVAAGFLVIAGDARLTTANANHWGAAGAQTRSIDEYRYARERYHLGPGVIFGASMGALLATNLLAKRTIPGIVGFYGFYGAYDLANCYTNSSFTAAIETAYGFSGAGNLAAAIAGYNPMARQGWEFRGVPMRFSASAADTAVPQAANTDLFRAKVLPFAPEAGLLQGTGAHGDASQTDLADALAFANRCIGVA